MSGRARNDDNDTRATPVKSVGGDDDGGTTTGLLGTNRITEVDQPNFASVRRHLEES